MSPLNSAAVFFLQSSDTACPACRLSLTPRQWEKLRNHQMQCCLDLEWVELDPQQLTTIAALFLNSPLVYPDTAPAVLCQAVTLYYQLRSRLSWKISDDELADSLIHWFTLHRGTFPDDSGPRLIKDLKRSLFHE